MIRTLTKYEFNGIEYNSLKEVQDAVHNIIGEEVLDKINRVCPPEQHKNLFALLEVLCSKEVRDVLTKCYNVTYTEEYYDYINDVEQTGTFNILDLK